LCLLFVVVVAWLLGLGVGGGWGVVGGGRWGVGLAGVFVGVAWVEGGRGRVGGGLSLVGSGLLAASTCLRSSRRTPGHSIGVNSVSWVTWISCPCSAYRR